MFAHGAIDIIPDVESAFLDEMLQIFVAQNLVHVFAGNGCGEAEEDLVFAQLIETTVGNLEDAVAAAFVVVRAPTVNADERRNVANVAQPAGVGFIERHAVGDDLKIAVAVTFENRPDILVLERLAAEQCVVVGVVFLASLDDRVKVVGGQMKRRTFLLDPATFAAQIAGIG